MRWMGTVGALRLAALLALGLAAPACVGDGEDEFVETPPTTEAPEAGEEILDEDDTY